MRPLVALFARRESVVTTCAVEGLQAELIARAWQSGTSKQK